MITLLKITFPISDPILIFALVLFIILIFPTLFKKLHLPEIIGLILAGVAVGPNGFNLLSQDVGLSIFSQTGLLYLMFLAGLEINVKEFLKNKTPSITFGILTFSFPFVLSGLLFFYIFNLSFIASLLISSMVASHTLVAYPIVGRFGITRNRVINIIVGGTIIADTIALLILAIVSESAKGQLDQIFWLRFAGYFMFFLLLVFFIIPRLSKWFFKNYDGESGTEYIFVLSMVFLSAVVAEYAHIEPIIGAFFAGLALSKRIPHTSPLMNRIEFIGNTIFIPFFLITVGMLADLKVLVQSFPILLIIFSLITIALFSKYIAAFLTQKIFRFTKTERNLIFGLSTARAASAIAIILVGFKLKLVDESIMNATIILILFSTLISSFVTQNSARKIALIQEDEKPDLKGLPERILIPISNPHNIEQLINLSVLIKEPDSKLPLYPFMVIDDDEKATENVINYNRILEKAKSHASSTDNVAQIISRIDTNIADGIARTVKEFLITKVVMGWHGRASTKDFFFGTILENVLQKTGKMIYVSRINSPLNLVENIHVLIPPAAELEIGFKDWVNSILNISSQSSSKIYFWGYEHTHQKIKDYISTLKSTNDIVYRSAKCPSMLKVISKKLKNEDLLVIINARKNSLSYNKHIKQIPYHIDDLVDNSSIVIIYPEQEIIYTGTIELQV
ncbi:MAG TPA: sodium:proton antiporter [Bacteroidales bacterium]|nr:sodium:proton antiporter [Bacteroidales bacterium]